VDDFDVAPEGSARTPDGIVPPPRATVHVAPLDVDGVRTVEVGTVLWGLAFVALLPFYSSLEEAGNLWWLWTCTTGLGLGLLGIEYCRRRRERAVEAGRTDTGSIPVVGARAAGPVAQDPGPSRPRRPKGRGRSGGSGRQGGSGGGRRKLV